MSDYPLWAYRQQLEQKAVKELGYNHPLQDQGRNAAIGQAIEQKVQEFHFKQQHDFESQVRKLKGLL